MYEENELIEEFSCRFWLEYVNFEKSKENLYTVVASIMRVLNTYSITWFICVLGKEKGNTVHTVIERRNEIIFFSSFDSYHIVIVTFGMSARLNRIFKSPPRFAYACVCMFHCYGKSYRNVSFFLLVLWKANITQIFIFFSFFAEIAAAEYLPAFGCRMRFPRVYFCLVCVQRWRGKY